MMNDIERELGRIAGVLESALANISRISVKLEDHIDDEDKKLSRIEQQLSLSRFLWLTVKAVALTIAFALAFKFGDIATLWKGLK